MHRLELFKLTGSLTVADLDDIDNLLDGKY